jgi:phosphate transport system substrate-binding protein
MSMIRTLSAVLAAVLIAAPVSAQTAINAGGATFPYPIYSKWFDEYHKLHRDIQINYQSLGSGFGIRQVIAGTADFGGSDQPMTDEQMRQAKTPILHFPTVLGAVVPTYNLAGVSQPLRFTPETLAGIFLGAVTKWNDAALAKANPGVRLPAGDIVVIHRSDGSGTTFVWTDYLSKVSPEWKTRVGANSSVRWPVGLGAKGNEGVTGLVKQTPNSIGYVELVYALQNKLPYGSVRNAAGEFVKAELASVTAAAAAASKNMPPDFRVSITNPDGKTAYPIASFTWLLIPSRWADAAKGRIVVDFLRWMLTDGQKLAQPLSYAPLPREVIQKELEAIKQIKIGS